MTCCYCGRAVANLAGLDGLGYPVCADCEDGDELNVREWLAGLGPAGDEPQEGSRPDEDHAGSPAAAAV